ncbi:alpha-1,3/1,6-mannosyltransferase ALG2 [Syncephalis pseudoplumigaleata]|uniref:Alpha-1,3/1,6-mannosyltransferase ALG2 n=1 Tax=Syncephalis pseudoplumigaleata TaxID=1712513 RepID=A0A4P9YV93_9FUNG|nr:alpha-1,3/1,6-mannosyltransferase ALG2 [Syncephalis pseudoplumigaleata]|eukprot:RKP23332.1 alpha-1,3/1,6-mannosyltransferase ALG2 [Syncephalis pseudoplumigaleata]
MQHQQQSPTHRPLQILVLHPDLGIGGAERLVVDAAVGLQSTGHKVTVYTNHHDRTHCFEETRDGTLDVRVCGDFLPRSIGGRFMVLCAIVRAIYLAIAVTLNGALREADVVFCDQVSAWIPILKYAGARVFFYCHFPDLLLSKRGGMLKAIYRWPVDMFEECTTGMADDIAVNSRFTADIFKRTFTRLSHNPQILYPGIRLDAYDRPIDTAAETLAPLKTERTMIVSINRFERKKHIALAIEAFVRLRDDAIVSHEAFDRLRLVIAGGYDKRVAENVAYLAELDRLAGEDYGLTTYTAWDHRAPAPEQAQVVFLPSFDETQRSYLLDRARALVYTPSGEHFGIVPVEAMYARLPVVAVADGGPTETVLDGETGYLCPADPAAFATAIGRLLSEETSVAAMGARGRDWVRSQFTLAAFVERLDALLARLAEVPKPREHSLLEPLVLFVISVLVPAFIILYFY